MMGDLWLALATLEIKTKLDLLHLIFDRHSITVNEVWCSSPASCIEAFEANDQWNNGNADIESA
ncbi:GL16484 [Drosophila persimilis]|uniref:GL16484 n=1 Tax=Drosophila persimilis TaxID=7234 RepID=B4GWA7_DROPE|nr:GL16484 [Drosophila persimilis]